VVRRGERITPKVLSLDQLQLLFADDPENLRALVLEAVENSGGLIDRLEALCDARSDDASKVLHELKGLTRTVGAEELGDLSERAEGWARLGQWDELAQSLGALRAAHERVAKAAAALGDDIAGSE
jgi:HPt (histidine-containing phosphotransfer) domain-containing protein